MALGGAAFLADRPCLYQPGGIQGTIPSHLRGGRGIAVLSASKVPQEALPGVCAVHGCLLRAGVPDQLSAGGPLGDPVVGLQRSCLACQWQNLPGRVSGLRPGRDGPGLPAAACV